MGNFIVGCSDTVVDQPECRVSKVFLNKVVLSARTSFAAYTASLLCKLAVYAALELFGAGFRKPDARNGTRRNLASALFYLFSKLAID